MVTAGWSEELRETPPLCAVFMVASSLCGVSPPSRMHARRLEARKNSLSPTCLSQRQQLCIDRGEPFLRLPFHLGSSSGVGLIKVLELRPGL